MTIKTCKTAVRASTLLAAIALSGGAFADAAATDSYNFETDGALGTSPYQALNGNGTVVADSYTYSARAGQPLTGEHAKVLEIAGTVTYTNAGTTAATTSSQVDFMFKVEPTDELENPTDADIQVALAVGTNDVGTQTAPIKLWCKTVSGSASADWVTLKADATTGSWVRATLVLDYSDTAKKCKVSLDGDPVLNGDSEWFYFAGTPGQQFVKSISMVGSTKIDDLKVSYESAYVLPGGDITVAASGQGSNVTYEYINKYGVTVAQATNRNYTCAESGMTVADKFDAGLNPTSDTKFEMQSMTASSATSATIKFPGNKGASGYVVTATADKAGTGTVLDTATITPGAANESGEAINSATFSNLPDSDLIYFHLKTN